VRSSRAIRRLDGHVRAWKYIGSWTVRRDLRQLHDELDCSADAVSACGTCGWNSKNILSSSNDRDFPRLHKPKG
jgi:hypothetical protein